MKAAPGIGTRRNKKRGHAETKKRELPDAGGDIDVVAFAQVQRVSNQHEPWQPKPRRAANEALPPLWSKFFDGSQSNAEDERIEPGPGRVIDPGLKSAKRDAVLVHILISQKCAEQDSAENDHSRNDHRCAM